MSKKKILKKKSTMVDVKKLTLSDLHVMYIFVSSLNNSTFGKKVKAKELFRSKLAEVEAELYGRVFGVNPFALDKADNVVPPELVEVKGQDPVKVIQSFGTGKNKTFVVASNEERK